MKSRTDGLWEASNEITKQHNVQKCTVGLHVHACGGQKSVLGAGPQGLLALLFETGPSLGLGTCQLDQAAWMASSRYLPPSPSSALRSPASATMLGF